MGLVAAEVHFSQKSDCTALRTLRKLESRTKNDWKGGSQWTPGSACSDT